MPSYADSDPNALDSHQSSPKSCMQSQRQADKLPVMSEKQTSPDSLESNAGTNDEENNNAGTNDEDNNNASPQLGATDNQSFLGLQVPTLQDT